MPSPLVTTLLLFAIVLALIGSGVAIYAAVVAVILELAVTAAQGFGAGGR